jgi:hypothetical protein
MYVRTVFRILSDSKRRSVLVHTAAASLDGPAHIPLYIIANDEDDDDDDRKPTICMMFLKSTNVSNFYFLLQLVS